jgi:hypothetical protein
MLALTTTLHVARLPPLAFSHLVTGTLQCVPVALISAVNCATVKPLVKQIGAGVLTVAVVVATLAVAAFLVIVAITFYLY